MEISELLRQFRLGKSVEEGTEAHDLLVQCSHDAMRITAELNSAYHTAGQIRAYMSELTGKAIDDSFTLFPPFYTDFGKNIDIGKKMLVAVSRIRAALALEMELLSVIELYWPL